MGLIIPVFLFLDQDLTSMSLRTYDPNMETMLICKCMKKMCTVPRHDNFN